MTCLNEMEVIQDNGIDVDGVTVAVEWHLCSDWKFLAEFLGLNAANAHFFCLWCLGTKADIANLDLPYGTWRIERTYESCCDRSGKRATDERCGSKHKPLFKVDFKKVIPDTLHLFLRIVEKVYKSLAEWAITSDRVEEFEMEALKAGVLFSFRYDQEGKVKYTELDANNAYKLLKDLDLGALIDGVMEEEKAERTKVMWRQLDQLYTALRVSTDHDAYLQPQDFHQLAKVFARNLKWLCSEKDMTPYLHCLVYHVPQFLETYGTIYQVNCQLVELKNHHHNAVFHRGSQKGGRQSSYCRQVLQRENRSLFSRVHGTALDVSKGLRRYVVANSTRERRLQQLKEHRAQLAKRRAIALARKPKRRCRKRKAAP